MRVIAAIHDPAAAHAILGRLGRYRLEQWGEPRWEWNMASFFDGA